MSSSKRRLLTGGINHRTMKAKAQIGRLNGNAIGFVRSLHSSLESFSSADALDMADTFARRHSKFCLRNPIPVYRSGLCLLSGCSRDATLLISSPRVQLRSIIDLICFHGLLQSTNTNQHFCNPAVSYGGRYLLMLWISPATQWVPD